MAPFVTCEPYVAELPLNEEAQFLILACDGVWDVLTDEQACDEVRKHQTPHQAAAALVKRAYDGFSQDNISVVVVFLQDRDKW